eukprot:scaffold25727_cov142-Cylindrotheca_fusiformis.AAC.3
MRRRPHCSRRRRSRLSYCNDVPFDEKDDKPICCDDDTDEETVASSQDGNDDDEEEEAMPFDEASSQDNTKDKKNSSSNSRTTGYTVFAACTRHRQRRRRRRRSKKPTTMDTSAAAIASTTAGKNRHDDNLSISNTSISTFATVPSLRTQEGEKDGSSVKDTTTSLVAAFRQRQRCAKYGCLSRADEDCDSITIQTEELCRPIENEGGMEEQSMFFIPCERIMSSLLSIEDSAQRLVCSWC